VLGSTLYKNVCAGVRDVATITANFTAWSKAGGQTLAGLLRRRQDEAKMFFGTGNTVVANSTSDTLIENVKDPVRIQLIKALQYNLNVDYNAKLTNVDGNIYQSTLDTLVSVGKLIVKGHKSKVVLWLQQRLVKWGYLKTGTYTDMLYDEATFQAVTNLQKNWKRPTDGVMRLETWNIFLNNK
jgi:lysozyme